MNQNSMREDWVGPTVFKSILKAHISVLLVGLQRLVNSCCQPTRRKAKEENKRIDMKVLVG